MLSVRGPQKGKRRRTKHGRRLPIPASNLTQLFLPRTPSGPEPEPASFSDRSRFGLWRPTTAQGAREGEMSKNVLIAEQEKNNEHCPEDIDDKLSESTDDDGEDTSDEDKEEDSNPNKDTHAPLELMTEFLRAEMGHDYHLAKKLCQMILIYEPENPEAKEFFSLIEEMLLLEKAQNLEEDDDESEDDNSESEGGSTEDPSEESSDECEDG
ncbi:glutamate-rich protein 2 isoform X1 [Odocoileus virginianus]|uniref:Glutamate-rich protein 2 isoform X1 n=2 Tax=Odocoileus virginianus TaxID=9874 RepID=A0A6J0Y497_ODOVR|nr:glutamate-rich protein 2 isoform X1 [Odocoileus virginianus texanus]